MVLYKSTNSTGEFLIFLFEIIPGPEIIKGTFVALSYNVCFANDLFHLNDIRGQK